MDITFVFMATKYKISKYIVNITLIIALNIYISLIFLFTIMSG